MVSLLNKLLYALYIYHPQSCQEPTHFTPGWLCPVITVLFSLRKYWHLGNIHFTKQNPIKTLPSRWQTKYCQYAFARSCTHTHDFVTYNHWIMRENTEKYRIARLLIIWICLFWSRTSHLDRKRLSDWYTKWAGNFG